MRLLVGNITTQAIIGGRDNLLDFDIMEVLRDYLKIKPDGYQHSEAYQEGRWDGYRYFINKKGEFATGFLPFISKYLEELGVSIEVEDNRGILPVLVDGLDDYIGTIDGEVWKGSDREHQMPLLAKLNNYINVAGERMYFPRGIYDAATNAGKNSISALIVNNLKTKYPTIFMVSTSTIYRQAVEFFSQVIEEPVGEVKSGKYNPKWFTVCMVKSLHNKAKKSLDTRNWLASVEVLIVDESDEAGANQYSSVLMYIYAGMRIFVSGTPLESKKVNNMIAMGLSGPILGTVTNKFLIDKGYSQKPIIKILLNNTPSMGIRRYSDEVRKCIHQSINRLKLIQSVLEEHDDKDILVSFNEKAHGYFMYNYLRNELPNIDMGIAHGTSKNRNAIIDDFKKGRISVLFASMILKRGANIPNIRVLIRAEGGKSVTTSKQICGRALRHDGVNDGVLIYDFYDVGKYVGKHSRDRIRTYRNEGFDVDEEYQQKRGKPVNI